MKYKPDDIPYDLAYGAYRGISFSPDERAKQEQQAYVQHMSQMVKKYGHLPGADSELERYREGYLKRYCAWLQARTRVMSPMITGPAKFPTARNDKNLEIEHKRLTEYIEWKERAIERLERNLGLRDSGIISSDLHCQECLCPDCVYFHKKHGYCHDGCDECDGVTHIKQCPWKENCHAE